MPGLVHNENGAAKGSPLKKNRLSLKFFHKKETKRALDFSETQEEEQTAPEPVVAERLLNPMYEGYLQHDAQEVLQCILSYIQEACETLKKEHKSQVEKPGDGGEEDSQQGIRGECSAPPASSAEEEGLEKDDEKQANGKRKSDTEAGNLKKKPKPLRTQKPVEEKKHFTRSKRKSSSDSGIETEKEGIDNGNDPDGKNENDIARGAKKKKHHKLGWLKSSNKQPSIFSKFRSVGKLSTHSGHKGQEKVAEELKNPVDSVKVENGENEENCASNKQVNKTMEEKEKSSSAAQCCFDLMERLFQGQLVLRTRCLECECYTERREDFQDISVPVQEDEPCRVEDSSEISPEPKMELKTLKWAISQFASVERIVGEDKYFCETCHHYTEAERSLLFDKTPEVVTIHLKCFAANSSEFDPYAGPSKVNTPLQTPLKLSLEEWCTKPSKEHYELFAVVMHNGVTISSGHYTTYVKMMDLGSVEIQRTDLKEESGVDALKPEPLDEETARSCDPQDYDDGEVSFSVSGKSHGTAQKVNVKKSSEGVGLLGGQRSISNFDLASSKAANPEKTVGALTDNGKCERSSANDHSDSLSRNGKECTVVNGNGSNECKAPSSQAPDPVLCNLLDYEGKWMLFDDCDVRLVEETEFLSSCSPASCSTSTPYLLFYKKVV
ncbi:Ubiquitin carboxyl-terminal hydrolase 1 [Acipenser ruthenus]|uniref:Ubiquitin carboxyl-terminal hydrolase 1 n=1 Tax=Acipenser ruthenus TaxID=7906 RepID=A0A662YXW1_ACIRT|nr:Ubiquitin carboxyl-terminal hydrolase 1 [Acipenser ruthenus]